MLCLHFLPAFDRRMTHHIDLRLSLKHAAKNSFLSQLSLPPSYMHIDCCSNNDYLLWQSSGSQYSSTQEDERAGPSGQGITIGGPNNLLSRFQPRNAGSRNMAAATQVISQSLLHRPWSS